jgi:hypothetical protein
MEIKYFACTLLLSLCFASAQIDTSITSRDSAQKAGVCDKAYQAGLRVSNTGQFLTYQDWHVVPEYSSMIPRFSELRKAFKSQGTEVILLLLPLKGMLPEAGGIPEFDVDKLGKNYQAVLSDFRKIGFITPDVLSELKKYDDKDPIFIPLDHHLTPYGGKIVSNVLSRTIKSLPEYKNIPKIDFETKLIQINQRSWKSSTKSSLVNGYCNPQIDFPDFPMPQYETKRKVQSELLSDEISPSIVSVGTSQSLPERNIIGFTSENTQADIQLSEYVNGAGAYLSMQRYLLSKTYQVNRPKLLIWEFSLEEMALTRDDGVSFFDGSVFKQLIPTVYGDCQGEFIKSDHSNSIKLLINNSKNSYIIVKNPDPRRTQLVVDYIDSKGEYRSDSINVNSRNPREDIFMLLPKDIKPKSYIYATMNGSSYDMMIKQCAINPT